MYRRTHSQANQQQQQQKRVVCERSRIFYWSISASMNAVCHSVRSGWKKKHILFISSSEQWLIDCATLNRACYLRATRRTTSHMQAKDPNTKPKSLRHRQCISRKTRLVCLLSALICYSLCVSHRCRRGNISFPVLQNKYDSTRAAPNKINLMGSVLSADKRLCLRMRMFWSCVSVGLPLRILSLLNRNSRIWRRSIYDCWHVCHCSVQLVTSAYNTQPNDRQYTEKSVMCVQIK